MRKVGPAHFKLSGRKGAAVRVDQLHMEKEFGVTGSESSDHDAHLDFDGSGEGLCNLNALFVSPAPATVPTAAAEGAPGADVRRRVASDQRVAVRARRPARRPRPDPALLEVAL